MIRMWKYVDVDDIRESNTNLERQNKGKGSK